jgi:Tol biopolymer transport system component
MSPEQTRAEAATSAGDIFSLGIVLYELLAGAHPFRADSPIDTAHAIAHAEPKRPSALNPGIPSSLNTLLLAMLDKDPGKRPTAIEVDRRLSEINLASVLSHARASDQSRDRQGAVVYGRSQPVLRVAAAVLLVSMAGGSLFWLRDRLFARKEPEATQLTAQVPENRVEAAAISPDGKIMAFAAMGGSVLLRRMSDGFTRPLNTPEGLRVGRIAWFPDQSKLLVSGSAEASDAPGNEHPGVWVMPADGGAAVKIVDDARDGIPSPDGARVAVSSADESIVWVAAADGAGARQIRSGGQTSSFSSLVWSPAGKRLAYQRRDSLNTLDRQAPAETAYLVNHYRYSYESVEVETGRVTASAPDVVMAAACGLPDGRILYLRWPTLPLLSFFQVWELRTDPASGKLLAPPRQLTHDEHTIWKDISASSDGKQVVAVKSRDSIANIYVADLPPEGEAPRLIGRRRLTFSEAQEFPHTWTADSRTIIFESDRNGIIFDLYSQNIERREAEPLVLSPLTKVMAHVTSDGKWLLYSESRAKGIWNVTRIPVGGGTPEIVVPPSNLNSEFRCGLKAGARCVLRMEENDQLVFYELDPVRGKGRELARTGWSPLVVGDWDISPDGSQVAIPNHDPRDAKLRLVALDPGREGVQEKTVTLSGLKNLNGVVWAASGAGWYVAARTAGGGILTYVDLQGHHTNLLGTTTPTYAVPSPDGRRIAFPDWSVSSNAWLFHGLSP